MSSDWSPADNPHAIAISESQWWQRAVRLAVLRLQDPDDQRISWFSSRQIDARQLIFALRQLLNAERLMDLALEAHGVDTAVRDALAEARQKFEDALPGVKHMRDALMHFDEWSRGTGKFGPQKERRAAGQTLRDVAREYWGFGYDPSTGTVSLGPYAIRIDTADQAATELSWAIYMAAREVDKKNAGQLLARTIDILTRGEVSCASSEEAQVKIRLRDDLRVWLSLATTGSGAHERRELSQRIVQVLTDARLNLVSTMQAENLGAAERLFRAEALYVEPSTS